MMESLHTFVFDLLQEGMSTIEGADARALALRIVRDNNTEAFILYDPSHYYFKFKEELALAAEDSDQVNQYDVMNELMKDPNGIAAYLLVVPSPNACHGAHVVVNAGALKRGDGPLMYHIAMSKLGKLAADRTSVSQFAENVWAKFYERSDVERFPFTDIEKGEKSAKEGVPLNRSDCFLHNSDRPWLNFAYLVKNKIDYKPLLATNKDCVAALNKLLKKHKLVLDDDYFGDVLYLAGDKFFGEVFKAAQRGIKLTRLG